MKQADGFVVLTERAREILFPESLESGADKHGRPVEVIPCCVNLERFASASDAAGTATRDGLGIGGRFVAAYVGSFGGWYMADETAEFFGALKRRRPDAFALVVTQSKPDMIEPLLRAQGYSERDYWIGRVAANEVPSYVSAADAAVSFIKPCYSKQASSPTKNAEYLACGVPVVANDGIGDTTEQITSDGVGTVISEFSEPAYAGTLDELDALLADRGLAARCRESARLRFDLESVGGERYRRLYRKLLGR
jgi:glycosyltransferase involved in cell wall biosynthesis